MTAANQLSREEVGMNDDHHLENDSLSQTSADMVEAKDYTVKQLRQVIFGDSQLLPRNLAVMLLERKRYDGKLDDMRRVLDDEQQDTRTRVAAATALGRLGTPTARQALRLKMDTPDDFLRRGIHQALDRIASAGSPEEAGKTGEPTRSTYELPFPTQDQFTPVDPSQARTVPTEPGPTRGMATMVKQVGQFTPGLRLSRENAMSLRCGGQDLAILLAREKTGPITPEELTRRKAVLGVVAVYFGLESKAWSPKYTILTQPGAGQDEVQVFLAKTRGRIAFAGTAQVKDQMAAFIIRALPAPGALPAEISGVYEAGALHIERLLVAQTRMPGLQPQPS
jgi:hypothetical protein